MWVNIGAPPVQVSVWHGTNFICHNLKPTTTWFGIRPVLWTWTKRWDEQWKDTQRKTHTLLCECKRWLSSRCSCDGPIRDSGVEAAPKSRSIIHRDRSSHCRKLWKQNILNGLSHPIHKRQLTVTHTPTHNNDHTDAISLQTGKSRIKNQTWCGNI